MPRRTLLPILLTLLAATATADEEIVLRSGSSGVATVLETTADSVTVEAVRGEAKIRVTIRAAELDPHCFYTLRRRHMKPSVDNHLALARFCLDNELFAQAKAQADAARRLDPERVEQRLADPAIRDGIAAKLLDHARKQLERERYDDAERWTRVVLDRFPGAHTKAAEALCDDIAKARLLARHEAKQAREAEREARIEAMKDEAERKQAQALERALAPIRAMHERGHRLSTDAVRARGVTQAKRLYEPAVAQFEAALTRAQAIADAAKKAGKPVPPEVLRLVGELRADAIRTYLRLGRLVVSRPAYAEARQYARKALKLDPDNRAVRAFLDHIALLEALRRSDRDN